MIGNDFLIDTNIIIDLFNGNTQYASNLDKLKTIYVSSIVLGELYVGVNSVQNKAKHLKILNEFLEVCTIIEVDEQTAIYYGELKAKLKKNVKKFQLMMCGLLQ